jgi:hypothetical protein
LSTALGRIIVEDFLKNSKPCINALVRELSAFRVPRRKTRLFYIEKGLKREVVVEGEHVFLRGSVEYSNPQLTVEELQGIIAVRLLEVCGNYFENRDTRAIEKKDVDEICERLVKSPLGKVVSFLLNTDDIEPDRYSMNPLKESIVETGQSAFPAAYVKNEELEIDRKFVEKYKGSLITEDEVETIESRLSQSNYMDMVDSVKYEQLEGLSESFGMRLCLPSMRMPHTVLEKETSNGLLHYVIRENHKDYAAVEQIYHCMGRSMKNRTTLLLLPHSTKGYGSKRAARGKIYFKGTGLKSLKVAYRPTPLYPNAIDPKDVSFANADDKFEVSGEKILNYDFHETPASPQFIIYSIASPEDVVLWHGIGAFGASELVKSYTSVRSYFSTVFSKTLWNRYGVSARIPLQFNVVPEKMWAHPVYDNIDASVGCVKDLQGLSRMGMSLELLPAQEYLRGSSF